MTLPEYLQLDGDRIVLPTFEIEVTHSTAAAQLLKNSGETIIVSAYFSGEPTDPKDGDDIGELRVATRDIELNADETLIRFSGMSFPREVYDKLADKDFTLLINVYSGRKSSEDNLLNCGIVNLNVSKIANQRFTIDCKLIEESYGG